jgi:hypothetical protein
MDHPKFDSAVERDAAGLKTSVSPLFLSYFMLDWTKVGQTPASPKCLQCGGAMMNAEPLRDKRGTVFDGLVCHHCKSVIWSRRTR